MTTLSTASWILHNLGLSTSIGGTLFGQAAFEPSLAKDVDDDQQRAQISDDAWSRYSWVNLASHGIVAATWFAGRSKLSGRETSKAARRMTLVKDVLVVASLATGIASVIVGKKLSAKQKKQRDENRESDATVEGLRKAVKTLGALNIGANAALGAVTTGLSMEAAKSLPTSFISRFLP